MPARLPRRRWGLQRLDLFPATLVGRTDSRSYFVREDPITAKVKASQQRSGLPAAQAICVKGTGGFDISDDGTGLP